MAVIRQSPHPCATASLTGCWRPRSAAFSPTASPGWQTEGLEPQQEASISKLFSTELLLRVANTGMQALGLMGQLTEDSRWAPLRGRFRRLYLWSLSETIGGGTSEVQRNIIATRGLALPRGT